MCAGEGPWSAGGQSTDTSGRALDQEQEPGVLAVGLPCTCYVNREKVIPTVTC